ncbi:hypothetical protein PoB_002692000 [Plakobranchus ocellatus]|uniref:Uncharacterized protein n=1 Tax=Plakobranchus ocellatus TaxID=259542 RepID=A0AAV3ZX22_9GAST|nr:hypothetical protein PoB_002692000 [Plakobranchus ocellatus]
MSTRLVTDRIIVTLNDDVCTHLSGLVTWSGERQYCQKRRMLVEGIRTYYQDYCHCSSDEHLCGIQVVSELRIWTLDYSYEHYTSSTSSADEDRRWIKFRSVCLQCVAAPNNIITHIWSKDPIVMTTEDERSPTDVSQLQASVLYSGVFCAVRTATVLALSGEASLVRSSVILPALDD